MDITAELSLGILNDIYELTYKYGWIKYDEDILGWLRDPAYKEKYKTEAELSKLLKIGFEELLNTYDKWLYKHSLEGFKYSIYSSANSYSIYDVLAAVDRLGLAYEPMLYQIVAEELGGLGPIIEKEDPGYLLSTYGGAFMEFFMDRLPENAREQFQSELAEASHEVSPEAYFIDRYSLYDEFKDWLINNSGVTAEQWLKEHFSVDNLMLSFNDVLDRNIEKILSYSYDVYLDLFERPPRTLRQTVESVKEAWAVLEQEQSGSLDERIKAFQFGLTTAHNFGTMADHLLGVKRPGAGQHILDMLSSGPHLEDWNRDLQKVLGHPPGTLRKETPVYWVEPEKEYLERVKRSSSLVLAAVLSIMLREQKNDASNTG